MADATVIQMDPDTWRIEDGGVRFFLLTGTESGLLIDSGMEVRNAREIAEGLTALPLSLLNTHSDRDHTGSNGQFGRFYMHPDEEAHYRECGGTGELIPVRDGEVISLGGRELRIIHLPGHTPGSIAVLDNAARVLYSGDTVQEDSRIFMFGAHRDLGRYIQSLEKLDGLRGAFDEIRASHGRIPIPPEVIRKLRDGALDIRAGKVPGRPVEVFGNTVLLYDLGFAGILCSMPEKA